MVAFFSFPVIFMVATKASYDSEVSVYKNSNRSSAAGRTVDLFTISTVCAFMRKKRNRSTNQNFFFPNIRSQFY